MPTTGDFILELDQKSSIDSYANLADELLEGADTPKLFITEDDMFESSSARSEKSEKNLENVKTADSSPERIRAETKTLENAYSYDDYDFPSSPIYFPGAVMKRNNTLPLIEEECDSDPIESNVSSASTKSMKSKNRLKTIFSKTIKKITPPSSIKAKADAKINPVEPFISFGRDVLWCKILFSIF